MISRPPLISRPLRSMLFSSRLSHTPSPRQIQQQVRLYSERRPRSPTGTFYQTFSRPVAKCLLLALLTYQIAYWGWLKLDQDEQKADLSAQIAKMETQARGLASEMNKSS
ncbi:hypothetical protein B0T25DRAFT_531599, partial [Lasiosphaeria hispida]